jgi:filamentous hemagglutinin family protein
MAKLSNILGNSTINGIYEKSISQFIKASIKLEGGRKLSKVSFLVLAGAIAFVGNPALAQIQIIPDHTLGAESSIVTPNVGIDGIPSNQIDGGAIRGVNLFHSFQEFNVNEGQGVYFTNPSKIENILSRVTGSNPSNIQGTLGVTGGDANLFLINPNGIIFGSNALLDVGGSFLASTANSFTFPDGTQFSATNPEPAPLLTVNVPIGLQYGGNAGGIQVQQGATLEVLPGKTLALVGGNVSVTGGRLLAQGGELPPPSTPGGRVELGGLAGAGTVVVNADGTLSFPDGVARADVSLTNAAQVNVSAGDGGSIAVNAHNLDISEGSRLIGGIRSNMGRDGAKAGDIEINATRAVTLTGSESRIRNSVNTRSIGNAGEIRINAESLTLTGGAQIDTTIYRDGRGNGGDIRVDVNDTVTLEGVGETHRPSRIYSEVMRGAIGNAGDIIIYAKSVYVRNGAQLNARTNGYGNAGNIKLILTDTLSLDGAGIHNQPSSINSSVQQDAIGDGGNISIKAESVFVTNGGQFNLTTSGAGNAGSLSISASNTVSFDGGFQRSDGNFLPSTAETHVESDGDGDGGTIALEARSIFLTNEAQVSVINQGSEYAGNLSVIAHFILLDNQAKLIAISTSGLGGSINVAVADLLLLRRNSLILAINGSTDTSGIDGNISIDTGSLVVVPIENSDIEAYGFGRHPGSNIQIIAPGLFGIEYREQLTPKSDIVSSGSVVLMTSGIDPSQGLTEIPTRFVEAQKPIDPDCTSGNVPAFNNRFTVTGRGGLLPNPYEPFSSSNIWEDRPLPVDRIEQPAHTASISPVPSPTPIVEAQAWLVNDLGEVVLVDKMPTRPRGCHYSF